MKSQFFDLSLYEICVKQILSFDVCIFIRAPLQFSLEVNRILQQPIEYPTELLQSPIVDYHKLFLLMKTFALYNLKGGVGKTTSCVNLAYLSALEGHKTLLWDIDPQSAASYFLETNDTFENKGIRGLLKQREEIHELIQPTKYNNLDLIPGDISNRHIDLVLDDLKKSKSRLKKLLSAIKNDYDYVFIDCPPALTLLSENVFRTADYVLMPMIPTTLCERTYQQLVGFFAKNNYDQRKIVPFFTLVDARKHIHNQTIADFRAAKLKQMRSIIPYSAIIEKMGIERAPLHHFANSSNASISYRSLWQELKWYRKLKPVF